MSSDDKELSDAFRLNASLLFQESCPEESRFFLEQHFAGLDIKNPESAALDKTSVCQYCFQWLRPENHRVRLRAKRRPSARLRRLLRRRAGGCALGLVQKRLLRRFWTSASALMATCHTCSKTSRHKGLNRELLSTFHTPGSGGKHKTPSSANRSAAASTPAKTPGKDKTAPRTPRSASPAKAQQSPPDNRGSELLFLHSPGRPRPPARPARSPRPPPPLPPPRPPPRARIGWSSVLASSCCARTSRMARREA
ncbi:UPF0711 protein C18orf21 homolog isoform X1 [Phycodurus eques]|uniref:UPF0711 protein C18orf21 homolog isoform X1 n=1 Tax=Phycodurus eques TaxID=693459 RepID=UPI002ACEF9F0|nr:UPF0711 protein C18orf21 homolog isoform X1 [Phycodurus eques]